MSATMLRRVGWTLGLLALITFGGWNWLWYGDAIMYRWLDLPAVRAEAARTPHVTLLGLTNRSDPEVLYVILRIQDKGDIALRQPNRMSFSGGGPLILDAIGECGSTPVLDLTRDPRFVDLRLQSVSDIAVHYDTIHQRVRDQGRCFSGFGLEPRMK